MQYGKSIRLTCVGLVLASTLTLTLTLTSALAVAAEPALYVYSTIDALLAGSYDGELTVKDLAAKGNFGIGTYNHLDGEMLVHDGVFYHVKSDGSVSVADPADKVPLAYVVPFQPSVRFAGAAAATLPAIEAFTDEHIGNKNLFYAIEIKGEFTGMSTRAIPAQSRPYKPLAEVSKTQSVFKRDTVKGTLVGFRSPGFSKGISVPGYHWHFISDDKQYGGHVLAAAMTIGQVSLAAVSQFNVELPKNEDFASADQNKDRSAELHKVESAQHQ